MFIWSQIDASALWSKDSADLLQNYKKIIMNFCIINAEFEMRAFLGETVKVQSSTIFCYITLWRRLTLVNTS